MEPVELTYLWIVETFYFIFDAIGLPGVGDGWDYALAALLAGPGVTVFLIVVGYRIGFGAVRRLVSRLLAAVW